MNNYHPASSAISQLAQQVNLFTAMHSIRWGLKMYANFLNHLTFSDRQTDRQTDRDRDREIETDRDRQTDRCGGYLASLEQLTSKCTVLRADSS